MADTRKSARWLAWSVALMLLVVGADSRGQAPAPPIAPAAEQPAAMLRVTSRVVAISAVVKAKDGSAATGLTKDDFELKQDGKPVPIRYCTPGADLPLTMALMVDTSGSQRTVIGDEELASDVFLQTMLGRAQDRAMVVQFDSHVRILGGLTNAAATLHLGLMSLNIDPSPRGGTLLNDAVAVLSDKLLAKETGRKAMILLTDGGDNGSQRSVEQAVEQAQLADVQIYSILYAAYDGTGPVPGNLAALGTGGDAGLQTLRRLSESTGGQVFQVSRGHTLRQIYAEIAQDLRLQYQVSYTPPPDLKPGSYHRLELRPKDRRLAVEARKGFFAKP